MTSLLLDFPWDITDLLGYDPDPNESVRVFMRLSDTLRARAVPFIEDDELSRFLSAGARPGSNARRHLLQFLTHCRREATGTCRAAPVPEPPSLRDSWKRALRDELGDAGTWRNPQIVVPACRREAWPNGDEVDLVCEACAEAGPSGPHPRVLAVLERYDSHPHATADFDPWDVRKIQPSAVGPRPISCTLPKPPLVEGVHFADLIPSLVEARAAGAEFTGKYYFIPVASWDPGTVPRSKWREAHAFPRAYAPKVQKTGFADCLQRIWTWHEKELHWDVQEANGHYIRVRTNGDTF